MQIYFIQGEGKIKSSHVYDRKNYTDKKKKLLEIDNLILLLTTPQKEKKIVIDFKEIHVNNSNQFASYFRYIIRLDLLNLAFFFL